SSSMPRRSSPTVITERKTGVRSLMTHRKNWRPGRIGDYSTNPPTEPYVKISLIRFLGTARFHTVRLPDIADNPRHLSPSALQHTSSQLLCVPGDLPGTIPTLSRSWAEAAGTLPSS